MNSPLDQNHAGEEAEDDRQRDEAGVRAHGDEPHDVSEESHPQEQKEHQDRNAGPAVPFTLADHNSSSSRCHDDIKLKSYTNQPG